MISVSQAISLSLFLSFFSFLRSNCIELDFREISYLVYISKHICSEILKNVSLLWNDVVKGIGILTIDSHWIYFEGRNISWPLSEQYPSCQSFDLFDLFNMNSIVPSNIFIDFNTFDFLGATLLLEERNKVDI